MLENLKKGLIKTVPIMTPSQNKILKYLKKNGLKLSACLNKSLSLTENLGDKDKEQNL